MTRILLKDIEQQIQIAQQLPLNRDILNIVQEYLEQSLPLYKKWADQYYEDTLSVWMGDKIDIYHKDNLVKRIIQIFLDYYGSYHIKLIDEIKNSEINHMWNILTINHSIAKDILNLFNLTGPYHESNSTNSLSVTLSEGLTTLWKKYQDPVFKEIFGNCAMTEEFIYFNTPRNAKSKENFLLKIENMWKKKMNPFETDIFTGQSFIEWVIYRNTEDLDFQNNKQRDKFESLFIEMLNSVHLDNTFIAINYIIGDTLSWSSILNKIAYNMDYLEDGNFKGWSPNLCFSVLKKINMNDLKEKENLRKLLSIGSFRSKETQSKFQDYLQSYNMFD